MNDNWIIYLVFAFVLYYFLKDSLDGVEGFDSSKQTSDVSKISSGNNTMEVLSVEKCKDCKIWNHRDAQTKCSALCKKNNKGIFTGIWSYGTSGIQSDSAMCECKYEQETQKAYFGCPLDNKGTQGCFIWNSEEAKGKCPDFCNTYTPHKMGKWTGSWKNTSPQTSACECEHII